MFCLTYARVPRYQRDAGFPHMVVSQIDLHCGHQLWFCEVTVCKRDAWGTPLHRICFPKMCPLALGGGAVAAVTLQREGLDSLSAVVRITF